MKILKSSSYREHLFYFLTFGLLIAALSSGTSYWLFHTYSDDDVQQRITFQTQRAKSAIQFFITNLKNNVEALVHSEQVQDYALLPSSSNLLALEKLMLNLMKSNTSIYQLRYLNASGDEVINIKLRYSDRGERNYTLTPFKELQDKSDRYYFQATKELTDGSYYISNLDLNKENGRLEIPYKPTLRLTSPVLDIRNNFRGALVANMDASYVLNIMTVFDGLDAYIVDDDGFIVYSNHSELNWSKYLGKQNRSSDVLGLTVNDLKNTYHLNVSQVIGNEENLLLFLSASKDLYQNHSVRALESSVLLVVIVVVLAVPLGLIVSYKPSKNAEMLSELMIEHQLYRDIVDQHVPIIDVNLKGNITRINAAMCNLSGFQEREVIGCSSSIFYHPDSEPKNLIDVWKKLSQGQSWSDEFHNLSKDGKTYWLHSNISPRYDPEGNKRGYIIVSSDITNRKRLQTISEMDSLTRLNNRSKLNRLLESEFNRAQRYLTPFVVLIVDIDRFKSVNDTYGHLVGDSVLIEVANILRYNVRQTDFVGRWGGEEFMIICPHSELDEGVVVAEKLCEAVNTFEFAEVRELSISIGVAVYENGCDIKSILEFADRNLYRAKSLGRNRVVSELGRYVCK